MTVRVTTLKGPGAGLYYTEQLPSYYLDGDEPPGVWWGIAAGRLGLHGEVDSEAFLAVMAGQDPTTRNDLGRKYGEGSVRGFDATYSAPKSVSVMFGLGDETVRDEVVEAHDAAVNAVLGWVEEHAHTRMRVHGHVMCVDTDGIAAAVFRQHTSRRLDPQLHTHAVIANRVLAPDGRWLALDARTIKVDQRTLSALYHAGLRAELTSRLGVRWHEPEHGIAEIADIPDQVLAEFSQRTGDIDQRMGAKLARFRTDLSRDPTPVEKWRLEREAAVDSRPAKRHGITHHQLHDEWSARVRRLGLDPHGLVVSAVGRHQSIRQVDPGVVAGMAAEAVAALEKAQSSWRPAEVLREVAAVFPTTIPADADRLVAWLQALSEHTVERRCVDLRPPTPAPPLRRDGRPITEAAVDRRLTTHTILKEEERVLAWADNRLSQPATVGRVDRRGLDPGQIEVAASIAGDRDLELVEGPAGAGKTTALAAGVSSLRHRGRSVFGVAPTAAAAEVLATETGIVADTLDKLLTEHTLGRPPLQEFDLPEGTTIIVDEAGTASTPALARLAGLTDKKRWRVILVGDPRQFSAVGRGGMFAHLVDRHGAVELDQVHRFNHEWERQASLQLRTGDPQSIDTCESRGRLHGGTAGEMEEQIIEAWSAARGRGETVAVMANSNDAVRRLNRRAQQTRLLHGEITFQKGHLRLGDDIVAVGDQVVTRRNDRTLRSDQGATVKNRDHWTVRIIHPDHSVTVTGPTGTVTLPAAYAARDLELGYAQTSHATQGRTVDTALVLIDTPTDSRGVYTPMTRGRESNHAYVVIEGNQTPTDLLGHALTREWVDQPATTQQDQLRLVENTNRDRDVELDELVRQSIARAQAAGPSHAPQVSNWASDRSEIQPDQDEPARTPQGSNCQAAAMMLLGWRWPQAVSSSHTPRWFGGHPWRIPAEWGDCWP